MFLEIFNKNIQSISLIFLKQTAELNIFLKEIDKQTKYQNFLFVVQTVSKSFGKDDCKGYRVPYLLCRLYQNHLVEMIAEVIVCLSGT